MKISKLKELGFEEFPYLHNTYALFMTYIYYSTKKIIIWYDSSTNDFTLNGFPLNISSISELKTFLKFFKT